MKRCEAVCSSSVAQWHNGTKAQGFDCIIGRMHGWIYFEILTVFSDERHTVITAQRHLNVYRFSHATRRDAHSVQGPALHSLFCRGQGTKAQWHKGTRLTIMIKLLFTRATICWPCLAHKSLLDPMGRNVACLDTLVWLEQQWRRMGDRNTIGKGLTAQGHFHVYRFSPVRFGFLCGR